jgi:hypothetical protein
MANVILSITFEGDLPGLDEGGLSIASFGDAMPKLLAAYRRIASGIVSDALDKPGYGKGGGKYAREAEHIDLELTALTFNSPLTLELRCSAHPTDFQPSPMYSEDLLEDAGKLLLRSIDLESKGQPRNAYVRRYLHSLPIGLRTQAYRLSRDNQDLEKVTVSTVSLVEEVEWPVFDVMTGNITGVGFEPGNLEVRGKSEDGKASFSAYAAAADVEKALALRGQTVEAVLWREGTKKAQLVGIGEVGSRQAIRAPEDNKRAIFQEWDEALRRLAQ